MANLRGAGAAIVLLLREDFMRRRGRLDSHDNGAHARRPPDSQASCIVAKPHARITFTREIRQYGLFARIRTQTTHGTVRAAACRRYPGARQ